jgi:hypothetical protein
MRKLIFIAAIVAGSAMTAQGQEVSKDSAGVTTVHSTTEKAPSNAMQDGFAQIETADLPTAVKKALESPKYKGWIINVASYNKKTDRYAVELKNGADTKKLKFNKEGEVLND